MAMTARQEFEDLPPIQTEIRQIGGTPENYVKAPYGYLITDTDGNVYVKQTDASLSTGWKMLATEDYVLDQISQANPPI